MSISNAYDAVKRALSIEKGANEPLGRRVLNRTPKSQEGVELSGECPEAILTPCHYLTAGDKDH